MIRTQSRLILNLNFNVRCIFSFFFNLAYQIQPFINFIAFMFWNILHWICGHFVRKGDILYGSGRSYICYGDIFSLRNYVRTFKILCWHDSKQVQYKSNQIKRVLERIYWHYQFVFNSIFYSKSFFI